MKNYCEQNIKDARCAMRDAGSIMNYGITNYVPAFAGMTGDGALRLCGKEKVVNS